MKGRLKKIDDKWVVEYSGVSYKGGNPKRLGSYTKKVEKKTLPLHLNFVTMTDYVWVKGIKVYDGDEVEFTQVLVNPMCREVDPNDLGQNHSKCVWYAKPSLDEKEEQKQHLIDMIKSDEELGLYDDYESYDKKQFKHEVTVIPKEEIIGKRPEKYSERFDNDKSPIGNPETWGKRMVDESREIKIEDIFNDEKREGAKRVIQQHKVLRGLSLVNPIHLFRVSDGHGEFPDGYKLTEKGIQYIIEQLNKE